MADFELFIKDLGTVDGWRIVDKQNQFSPNPTVGKGKTVSWHSPEKNAVCIAIFADSPFTEDGGQPFPHKVLEIQAGGKSEELQIANNALVNEEYEYAVLVRDGRDFIYVRGAASPPGVIVGP